MKSIEGKYIFEIIDAEGLAITSPFMSEKSLNSALVIYQKFDPHFHENHKVKTMRVMPIGLEEINPPPEPEAKEIQLEEDADAVFDSFAEFMKERKARAVYAHCARCLATNTGKPLDDGTFQCEVCKTIIVVDK